MMVRCTHVAFLFAFLPKNKYSGKAVMRVFVRALTSFGGLYLDLPDLKYSSGSCNENVCASAL